MRTVEHSPGTHIDVVHQLVIVSGSLLAQAIHHCYVGLEDVLKDGSAKFLLCCIVGNGRNDSVCLKM